MPIQLNDDTIDILYFNGTISYTIDKSYDDSNVISLLSTSNITFLEGGGGLNVNGNINFTGDLTKGGEVFSSYDDTDVISLLSTSNITLFNSNIGIGKSEPGTTIDVVGNINISTGSRYQVNGSDLSFNEVDGILTLEKGGTGRTTIDEFKTMLGISTSSSEYEITDISPAYFNLTTTGKVDINDVDYMEPMTFTIYGKNFDRNIRIKIVDNSGTIHTYINTIYYDSPVKIRAVTKYIKFSEINQVDKYPYKIKIYHKDDITKHAFSGYIYKDENDPTWLYDNNYRAIYNIDNGFEFTINDSDTNNILSYELVTGAYLIPNLSFNSQTGKISGIPEIFDTDINLTINAKSGSISLPTRDYTLHIFSDPKINTVDQELLVSNYFDLLAESKANVIQYADTSITWSLIDYDSITEISDTLTYYKYISGDNTEFISLSGNRIIVSNLNSLGIDGKYITLEATDAYGYSITKTINIKKLVLSGPTIHTGDQELLSNTFNLSATSAAGSISDADTNVYWSLNGDYSNISLSGNTINVTDLDLLEELGKDIIVLATDAYGYSSTKTINIKNLPLIVYSFGFNDDGELGLGHVDTPQSTPQEIKYLFDNDIKITQIACGYQQTMFLASDGKVYGVGKNNYGQLGLGYSDETPQTTPQEITFFNEIGITITQVVCGEYHTIFLGSDGKVYSVGRNNNHGQLGLGHKISPQTTPQEITFFSYLSITITQIACGSNHTMFLASDGKVYGVGQNDFGQLGLGYSDENPQTTPQEITYFNSTTIKHIACGQYHTIFLASDGNVYSVGYNGSGQLGRSDTETPINEIHKNTYISSKTIKQIACGFNHTIFLASNGTIYGCGNNNYGQRGLGHSNTDDTIAVITYFTGTNFTNNGITITQIACCENNTMFLASNGKVYSCGANTYGQLGISDTNPSYEIHEITFFDQIKITQVVCGKNHILVYIQHPTWNIPNKINLFETTFDLEAFNYSDIIIGITTNITYSLDLNGNTGIYLNSSNTIDVVDLNSLGYFGKDVIVTATDDNGYSNTKIINIKKAPPIVYCVGLNDYGQLGLGHNETPQLAKQHITYFTNNGITITQIEFGEKYTIFLASDGKVYGVGQNNYGQLGLDHKISPQTTIKEITFFNEIGIAITQIASGENHTIFLASDGKVYGVGQNNYGQLGLDGGTSSTPESTIQEITFLNDKNITQIACGANHTIFSASDNKVYSCGYNENGQLGRSVDSLTPSHQIHEITYISGTNIKQIACGNNNTMFLANDGSIYGCGLNENGQLGLENTDTISTPQEIEYFSNNTITIKQIACGENHTIFLASDGKVYGVGQNNYGQLGLDGGTSSTPESTIQEITFLNDKNITQIACGANHTIFSASDNKVYSCGYNENGQLGRSVDSSTPSYEIHEIPDLNNIKIAQIACGLNNTIFLESI